MSDRLQAKELSLAYDGHQVVEDLDLDIADGRITTIIGANGSGKSTLLGGLARLLKPAGGAVLLDGKRIHDLKTKEVARQVGLLPQAPVAPDGILVEDLVSRGRYPHQSLARQWSVEDERAVGAAIDAVSIAGLRGRAVDDLSGGERQRVWIALALAQAAGVLLLDEPTTFLDIAHQVEVLDLLAGLNERDGLTVVLALHDINQACRYSDVIVAMRRGRIDSVGPPGAVVTAAMIRRVYDLEAKVIADPVSATPLVIPVGTRWASG